MKLLKHKKLGKIIFQQFENSPGNEMWIKCGFNWDYLWLE